MRQFVIVPFILNVYVYPILQTVTIFGRDMSKMPCFRSTFLFSISSGIGAGLLGFMFTSKVRRGTDIGVYTFLTTTLVYWGYCRSVWLSFTELNESIIVYWCIIQFLCRYNWSKERILGLQMQEAVRLKTLYRGTELEKQIEATKE